MKNNFLTLVTLILVSCSSSEEESFIYDSNLLYNTWYNVGLCNEQNKLTLTSNYNYTRISSSNENCILNENDTYKYTGTYSISGSNDISFNQETSELLIEGTSPNNSSGSLVNIIYTKIISLTNTELVIEQKFNAGGQDSSSTTSYNRQ